jgi:hypothetical protein
MFRRRPGKPAEDEASAYSLRSSAADFLWLGQDRLKSGTRSAFGRLGFAFQERLIWPLQDRTATIGAPGRALSGAAAVVLAGGAVAVGLLVAGSGDSAEPARTQVAVNTSAPTEAPAPSSQTTEPTLEGAAPVFKSPQPAPSTEVDPAKAIVKSAPPAESATADEDAEADTAAASSSANASEVDGPPAGPAAIAVARDFADAFVLYETGETDAEVRSTFAETATPALSKALLERPPRLPANVEVPKAKVLNVVPAPSHGDVYPLSVSLLRVGVTSELRIDMEQRKGEGWRVTNVLG